MDPLRVAFLLFPNVTQLDLTGPAQVLSRLGNAKLDLVWKSRDPVPTDAGFAIVPTATFAEVEAADILCVPGGIGVAEVMQDEETMAWLRQVGAGAQWVTSVCTGSLILAAAGFLKGKRAACHWAWRDLLVPFGAIVDDSRVARDGNIITGGGVTAGLDFAFVLMAELAGETLAKSVQLGLEYAPSPPFASGRPELASPEILAAVKARMEPFAQSRLDAVKQVAARLETAQ